MDGTPNTKELLSKAAGYAQMLLPEKTLEREVLRRRLEDLDLEIGALNHLVTMTERFSGGADVRLPLAPSTPVTDVGGEERKKLPPGQIEKWIDEVLVTGVEMSERQVREAIQAKHGVELGRSSVYVVLKRGAADRKYEDRNAIWSKRIESL